MSPCRTFLRWLSARRVNRRKSRWASWPVQEIISEWLEGDAEWGAPAPTADAWFKGSVTGVTGPFVRLRPDSAPATDGVVAPTLLGFPMRFADQGELGARDGLARLGSCLVWLKWSPSGRWSPFSLLRSFRFRHRVRRAIRVLPGVQSVSVNRHNVIAVNVEATSFELNLAIRQAVNDGLAAVGGWVNHCLVVGEDEHGPR